MTATTYTEESDLSEVFVGRKIVDVQFPVDDPKIVAYEVGNYKSYLDGNGDWGVLTLDDGTKVYAIGHEGGCACSAGCYELKHLAGIDNVITKVEVADESAGDYKRGPDDLEYEGRYRIYVYADNVKVNAAEFLGTDGNGYYGTGFSLAVVKP